MEFVRNIENLSLTYHVGELWNKIINFRSFSNEKTELTLFVPGGYLYGVRNKEIIAFACSSDVCPPV